MSLLKVNAVSNVLGTQQGNIADIVQGYAKAWVNFNGQGTLAVRSSYNVSSVTDLGGLGQYRVNFTNNLADANYAVVVGGSYNNARDRNFCPSVLNLLSSSFELGSNSAADGTLYDAQIYSAAVFR